jgi:hypothetical protein
MVDFNRVIAIIEDYGKGMPGTYANKIIVGIIQRLYGELV